MKTNCIEVVVLLAGEGEGKLEIAWLCLPVLV